MFLWTEAKIDELAWFKTPASHHPRLGPHPRLRKNLGSERFKLKRHEDPKFVRIQEVLLEARALQADMVMTGHVSE